VAAPAVSAPASKVVAVPAVHVVNRGDTLLSIARRNHVPVAQLAKANGLDASAKLNSARKSPCAARRPRRQRRRRGRSVAAAAASAPPATRVTAVPVLRAKRAAGPGHDQG